MNGIAIAFAIGLLVAFALMKLLRRVRGLAAASLRFPGSPGQPTFITPPGSAVAADLSSLTPLIDEMMQGHIPPGVRVIQSSVQVRSDSGEQIPVDVRELMASALEACPGCGAREWRGQAVGGATPQLVCQRCGLPHP